MSEQSVLQIQENENAIVATIQCSEFDYDTTAQLRAEIDGVIAPTSTCSTQSRNWARLMYDTARKYPA